jgi:disease resistance protein RPM1
MPLHGKVIFALKGMCPHVHARLDAHGDAARGKVRRLSIHGNDNEKAKQCHRARHGIEAMDLQHVRSLTTFQLEGLDKAARSARRIQIAEVLDLEHCKAMEDKHMKHLCHTYLLRYLGLRGTQISAMPSKIGNLEYLETLDVEMMGIKDLPPTVTKLSNA